MGVLKILFLGVFFTFPLGVLIRISITPQAYVYPVDVAVLLFVMYGLYQLMVRHKKTEWFGKWKYFIVACVISLLINIHWLEPREFLVSSLYLFRILIYILLSPIISYLFSKKDSKWILTVIAFSLFATVIIGLFQYFIYPDLRNLMYLGWDEHLYRIFSTFLDPNFASLIFVSLIWILAALLYLKKSRIWQYAWGVGIFLTGIALLLTYSRTGYLALIASVVIYLILNKNMKLLIVTILFIILGITFLPKDLRSEGVNLFRTASIYSRFESYEIALEIFYKNPLVGVGFNAYRYAQEEHISKDGNIDDSHAGAGVSNSYLFVLVTTGVVGFVTFIFMCFNTIKQMSAISSKQLRGSFIALFTALLVGSLTENILFYSFILIILFSINGVTYLFMEKSAR